MIPYVNVESLFLSLFFLPSPSLFHPSLWLTFCPPVFQVDLGTPSFPQRLLGTVARRQAAVLAELDSLFSLWDWQLARVVFISHQIEENWLKKWGAIWTCPIRNNHFCVMFQNILLRWALMNRPQVKGHRCNSEHLDLCPESDLLSFNLHLNLCTWF